jgi:hypothetical protein
VDAIGLFLTRHQPMHARVRANGLPGLMAARLADLTDAQLRWRPQPGVNSIVWLLWHVARTEDFGVNRFVADRPQVLDEGAWLERLRVPRRDIGTGMTDEQVAELSETADLSAVRGYWEAVGERTARLVSDLDPAVLDTVVDDERVRRVFVDEGVMGPGGAWVIENGTYNGCTRGFFLAHLGLTHTYTHFGEIDLLRGLLGFRGR